MWAPKLTFKKNQPSTSQQHHVDGPAASAVNGNSSHDGVENKRITGVEDQTNSAEASGGSDTEASRTDSSKAKDAQGRTTPSLKKPATFKAVSVNKTFLASKAPPPSNVVRASEKIKSGSSTPPPGSSTLSASRPRLVAKTGSGARDSASRASGANGGKPASAPDPSAVWNKNMRMSNPLDTGPFATLCARFPFPG